MVRQVAEERHIALTADEEDLLAARFNQMAEVLRRYHADGCLCLFIDKSRNRSRRWCDMADCGNQAKVRRFRERARAEGEA